MSVLRIDRTSFGKLTFRKPTKTFWLVFILTIPHMDTDYLSQLHIVGDLIDICKVVSLIGIVWLYIIKRRKPSVMAAVIISMEIYIWIITAINQGSVYRYAVSAFSTVCGVLLYDLFLTYDTEDFLSAQLLCFEIIIYINLVTEILYPDGMYMMESSLSTFTSGRNWFLGYYNRHSKVFIPALMIAFLYAAQTGKKLRTYMMYIVIWISAIIVWSGGVLLSLGIMSIIYLFLGYHTKLFNYYNYWFLHIVFFVLVICFKVQNLFYWLIEGILHKWSSFSARINLWNITLLQIADRPILGHGYKIGAIRAQETGMLWGTYAHNMVLEVMYRGGLVYLLLYIFCIVLCGKNLMKYKDTKAGMIISCACVGWCICNLVEFYASGFLMALFIVGYYCGDICRRQKTERE